MTSMTLRSPRMTSVRVDGGDLAVGEWNAEASGPVVLAVHGITATHRAWNALADSLGAQTRVIAPDLRGRGGSAGLPAPYTLVQHADDLARVLDGLGVERAYVVGHSMGAFVAVRLAERHTDRVVALALIDGGVPIPLPSHVPADEAAALMLGPALERLSMTFRDAEEHREFWRRHPALAADWSTAIEDYVDYDLVGRSPHLRSSANAAAVSANALELDGSNGYAEALRGLAVPAPIDFFRAPRGLQNTTALYARERLEEWSERMPELVIHEVDDVNHYTVVMAPAGAAQVAPVLNERLTQLRTKGV